MQPLNYRFNIWTPTGTFSGTRERDVSHLKQEGMRLQVTPEGDAREGSWAARGNGMFIPSLSAVQVELEGVFGFAPIFYGQVRQGGNARDMLGENYILRSLGLRLHAVTLSKGFTAPKQPAHLTVRAIIQDVIASGQLGSPPLIEYAKAGTVFDTIPDLPFDCREIKASNQQIAGALLDQIVQDAAGMGVEVRWGVRPDRQFYFRVKDESSLILNESDMALVTWKAPVAETPCTAVLWFVAQNSTGDWLTHQSISPAAAQYGVWVQRLSLPTGLDPWLTIMDATYTWKLLGGGVWDTAGAQPTLDPAVLKDRRILETDAITSAVFNVPPDTSGFFALEVTSPVPIQRVAYGVRSYYGAGKEFMSGHLLRAGPMNEYVDRGSQGLPPGLATGTFVLPGSGTTQMSLAAVNSNSDTTQVQFDFTEFRAERLDTALLDNLAKYHYQTPAQEPAEIPLRVSGNVHILQGRVEVGDYSRAVDAWEYRISAARGLEKVALTGQADDPNKLAQAALIKANDGKAVITAITAQR